MSFRDMLAMAGGRDTPEQSKSPAVPNRSQANRPPLKNPASRANVKTPPPPLRTGPIAKPAQTAAQTSGSSASARPQTQPRIQQKIEQKPQPKASQSLHPKKVVRTSPSPARAADPTRKASTPTIDQPVKKFSFKDVMKKAESVDVDKLKVQVKAKERRVESPRQTKTAALLAAKSKSQSPPPSSMSQKTTSVPKQHTRSTQSYQPAPIAKPSAKLAARLKRKASDYDDSEDDMDDFIDDDEPDPYSKEPSYRDEIWKMFNRGRSRNDFVDLDSDDDMEATGTDILAEELRSTKHARLEDEQEELRLKRLAAEKARRKARK